MRLRRAGSAARAGAFLLLGAVLCGQPQTVAGKAAAVPSAPGPGRLEALLAGAEKALAEGRRGEAIVKVEEASSLIAGWAAETLRGPEALALMERLRALEMALQGPVAQAEPGMKVEEEIVALMGEDLRAEMQRVLKAEAGATFDFPIDLNDKVLTWVNEFSSRRKGFIERALGRGTRYMPMVRQIFAEEGVPQDLVYLAVIESGFQNHARSYAAAVGMWQFIRSTGRIYGLKGSAWVEERRDPVKSARASARYLRRLYEISGDWYLALVGYNAGPLTVDRAVANVESRNFWDLARSRWLRNQTKNYVPEILAAILIGKNPERFGLAVVPEPPFTYETVQVDRMTSLAVLAKTAGVAVGDLKDLNPELLRGSTPPGGYTLRVPPGYGPPTARALAGLTSSQRLDFRSYTVQKGDTLAKVAARFKVSQEDLLSANDLAAAQFRPGRHIKVPPRTSFPIAAYDLRERSESKPLVDRPLDVLPAFPKSAPVASPAPPQPGLPAAQTETAPRAETSAPAPEPTSISRFVIADAGDSLLRIAAAHGAPLAELQRLNPGLPERLLAGTRIRLPDEKMAVSTPDGSAKGGFYLVRKGDTLVSVAAKLGLDPADLKAWNRLPTSKLKPGQRLRLSPP